MVDHVTIRVADREASERFYRTVLAVLGAEPTHCDEALVEWRTFGLAAAGAAHPVTRGLHIGFAAPSREVVDAFWRAGVDAGYRDDGAPGPRPQYREDYYGGFLLDPDGNSAEAVHHGAARRDGLVDHLWIRVADVAASKRFYSLLARHAGLRVGTDTPERVSFDAAGGSFSLVAGGRRTEHVHFAFTASEDAAVDAFHAAAVGAGHPDDGPPGERPHDHPGSYAAVVLDPDGHEVTIVNHRR